MINLFKPKVEQPRVKPVVKIQSTVKPVLDLFTPSNFWEWQYFIQEEANKKLSK